MNSFDMINHVPSSQTIKQTYKEKENLNFHLDKKIIVCFQFVLI